MTSLSILLAPNFVKCIDEITGEAYTEEMFCQQTKYALLNPNR